MKIVRTYRCFTYLKGFILPLMMLVMLGSQFPLSAHCYEMLLGSHQTSTSMACMKNGVCMMKAVNGMKMECSCHSKNDGRPFFCSCGTSTNNPLFTLQLSKVLLPDLSNGILYYFTPDPLFLNNLNISDTVWVKDIFRPPQAA